MHYAKQALLCAMILGIFYIGAMHATTSARMVPANSSDIMIVAGHVYPWYQNSPWTQPLPSHSSILVDPNSSEMIAYYANNLEPDANGHYTTPENMTGYEDEPVYFASNTDPLYIVNCTYYACPTVQGKSIHIPAYAVAEGNNQPGDGHMTVISPNGSIEYDLFAAQNCVGLGTGGECKVEGAKAYLINVSNGWYSGLIGYNSASSTGGGGAINSGTPITEGLITPQELLNGVIPHALDIILPCAGYLPAPVQGVAVGGYACSPKTAGIGNGYRIFLNMSDSQIQALGVPAYDKIVLTSLAHYGAFVTDTGCCWEMRALENYTYTNAGYANPWTQVYSEYGIGTGVGFRLNMTTQVVSNLKVISPSDTLLYMPPAVTTSTSTTSTSTTSTSSTTTIGINYVPITLVNRGPAATPSPFQIMLGVNSSDYKQYIKSGWSNIEFTTKPKANGTPLYAWVESNATNTSKNTVVFVKIPSSIAQGGTLNIYMNFLPSGLLSASGPTGEAPQIGCAGTWPVVGCSTYAKYDDGASVFNFYDNFAGQVLSSLWNTPKGMAYSVDNALIITNITGNLDYGLRSAGNEFASGTALDFFGSITQPGTAGVAFGVMPNTFSNGAYILSYKNSIFAEQWNSSYVESPALAGVPTNGVFTVETYNSTTYDYSINYSGPQTLSKDYPTLPSHIGIGCVNAGCTSKTIDIQWIDTRTIAPDVQSSFAQIVTTTSTTTTSTSTSISTSSTSLPTTSSSTVVTTIATTVSSQSSGGGSGGGGAGGNLVPAVTCNFADTSCTITDISNPSSFNTTIGALNLKFTENFISPNYVGVSVNGTAYTLYENTTVLLGKSAAESYYVRLINISWIPMQQTFALQIYSQPNPTNKTAEYMTRFGIFTVNGTAQTLEVVGVNNTLAPIGYSELYTTRINVSGTNSSGTLRITAPYQCGVVAVPYELLNNIWIQIANYSENQAACQILFTVKANNSITVSLMKMNAATPATATSVGQNATNKSVVAGPTSDNWHGAEESVAILLVFAFVIVVVYYIFKILRRKPAPAMFGGNLVNERILENYSAQPKPNTQDP